MLSRLCAIVLIITWPFARVVDFLHRLIGEITLLCANEKDWDLINKCIYRTQLRRFGKNSLSRGLWPVEKMLIEKYFPAPPAELLVLAAGSGRELDGLIKLGYCVTGLDMVPKYVSIGKNKLNNDRLRRFVVGSFSSFASGSHDELLGPFEGVIIGWGGFSHIPSDTMRHRLLAQIIKVAPNAPVILSWSHGTAESAGRRFLLKKICSKLGMPLNDSRAAWYEPRAGFFCSVTEADLRQVAQKTGYQVMYCESESRRPFALLRPQAKSG